MKSVDTDEGGEIRNGPNQFCNGISKANGSKSEGLRDIAEQSNDDNLAFSGGEVFQFIDPKRRRVQIYPRSSSMENIHSPSETKLFSASLPDMGFNRNLSETEYDNETEGTQIQTYEFSPNQDNRGMISGIFLLKY